MIEPIQIMWSPAGVTMQSVGARALVDVMDGDTPNIRMPIRMLSVDTPEVTARSEQRVRTIDEEFRQLAEWIEQGRAPISRRLGDVVAPKLATGRAGTPAVPAGPRCVGVREGQCGAAPHPPGLAQTQTSSFA
ncbi:MAG: hypothetical protein ACRDSF_17975 [Pseudonocardiaceae bacterium]